MTRREEDDMRKKIVNLTPHPITLYVPYTLTPHDDEEITTIPPSGEVARVETLTRQTGRRLLDAPIVSHQPDRITGLPAPEEGTTYVVSLLVRQTLGLDRADVVAPDTGPGSVVRDPAGRIVGIRRWVGVE